MSEPSLENPAPTPSSMSNEKVLLSQLIAATILHGAIKQEGTEAVKNK